MRVGWGQNPPDWQDDPGCCAFTSWIVGGIVLNDGVNLAESDDMFAAFNDAGTVRGVGVQLSAPFGPYEGQILYEMTMRSNDQGEILTFKYYDASEDAVLDIAETYTFVSNEQQGDMFEPVFFNIGADEEECMDDDAAVGGGGCAWAVATFGCDMNWGDATIGELCPVSCDNCPGRPKSIFCHLEDKALQELDQSKNANVYKKGQNLFLEGNPPFGLYCLHSGKVKISKTNSEGDETIVRIVHKGDVVGHRSLFSNSPYTASATVIEEGTICFVSKDTIQSLIKMEPQLASEIISRLPTLRHRAYWY